MATIAEIRQQYPQYNDISDQQLADKMYAAHYSDMPRQDFDAKVGLRAPRWDVAGDVGRAAEASGTAVVDDAKSAFPNPLTMDVGPVASLKRMGSALKTPLDALGVVTSPLTGLLHSTAGSALSYVMPTPEKDVTSATGTTFYSDPKKAADQILDSSLLGLAPRGMGSPAGLMATSEEAAAANAARKAALLKNKAISRVNARAVEDGLTGEELLAAQADAAKNGDKLTLMDVGNKNVRGLAGAVYRAPGKAGKHIDDFLEGRDTAATGGLTNDVQALGRGSSYHNTQALFTERSNAAREPYRAALEADSVAPFEAQYRQAVIDANSRKAKIGKEIAKIEREQSGALASRGAAGKATRDRYMQLRDDMEGADAERAAWDSRWKEAQSDRTSGAPGAVWSPRLQQFIDHPEVQAGLRAGLKLEKQDAITQRRTYKDSDYSIVGVDEKGEPILGQVPTMKSLAVAKEGLDARIAELKDPKTGRPTKAGVSLKNFRDEFVSELDRLNPRYKAAREKWSGPSQTLEAVEEGKTHFTRTDSNEQVLAEFNKLSEADKDFYRVSAAEAKIDALERAPDASDKSKRIINNERDRKRFRMLFKSDAEADKFIQNVARKRQMFDTKTAVKSNSATAGRITEDENHGATTLLQGAHGLGQAASGNFLGAAHSLYRVKRDLGLRNNPDLNLEIARILTSHDLPAVANQPGRLLPELPVPKKQRTVASAAVLDALLNAPSAPNAPRNKH